MQSTSPRRLARPRTSPFHGGNTGSNPVGDANLLNNLQIPSGIMTIEIEAGCSMETASVHAVSRGKVGPGGWRVLSRLCRTWHIQQFVLPERKKEERDTIPKPSA